jgi:predicted nucleotidyltransferase
VRDFDAIRWIHLSDEDIATLHRAVAVALAPFAEVIAAYHYGSSARRQPARDIDIGLVVERAAMMTVDVGAITERIAAASGRAFDEFDVRVVNEADPVFLGNLMRDGKLCFERDREQRIAFEVMAHKVWLDFKPAWERVRRRVLEVWARG